MIELHIIIMDLVCRHRVHLIGFIAQLFPIYELMEVAVSKPWCLRKYIKKMPKHYDHKGLRFFIFAIVQL